MEYLRIGIKYYRIISSATDENVKELISWNKTAMKDDFGKDFIKSIPKFDSAYHLPDEIKELYRKTHPRKKVL